MRQVCALGYFPSIVQRGLTMGSGTPEAQHQPLGALWEFLCSEISVYGKT